MADSDAMQVDVQVQEHFEEQLGSKSGASTEDKKPEDLSKDGGVLKEIIKEGEGWEKPSKGSDVSVHYTGTLLDGTKFDSSVDRNTPFEFQIDAGSVIKGWDIAVKSMKKAEKAKFTLKPEYAYGAAGSPPKIPANSTLVFEIELLSFKNEKDITNDGGVLKKVLQEGREKYGPSPAFESRVKVHLLGRLNEGSAPFVNETREIVIGEDESVPTGVEKAIESLKVGEKALFFIRADYAYGEAGNASLGIPAGATLKYEIELLELKKEKDYWDYEKFEEKLEQANKRKTQGNECYSKGKFDRAIAKYKRAVDFIDYLHGVSDEDKKRAEAVKLSCQLNMAMCALKKQDWNKAIEHCNKALDLEKNNAKAIYRRAVAHSGKDNWDLARGDFELALTLMPGDADVVREYNKLKLKMKQQDERDKKVYSNMFKAMFSSQPAAAPAESVPAN